MVSQAEVLGKHLPWLRALRLPGSNPTDFDLLGLRPLLDLGDAQEVQTHPDPPCEAAPHSSAELRVRQATTLHCLVLANPQ